MSSRTLIIASAIMLAGFAAVMALVMTVSNTARWRAFGDEPNGLVGSGDQKENNSVDSSANRTDPSQKETTLRFAIAPVISPENSYVSYKNLVNHVASELNREGQIITRSSYSETNQLIKDKLCDVALICTYSYLQAKRDFGAKLLAAPVVDGMSSYHSYIIVNTDSPIKRIEDLKGKSFAYADDISTSGWLYLAVWLKNHTFDPMHFFSDRTRTGSHDSAIHAVADNQIASAAVDSIVFEHMPADIKNRVRVIHKSPAFGMPPLVTPADIDESFRLKLLAVILSLHESDRGKELLSELKIDKFQIVDNQKYQRVQDLMDQWETE